jgi:hypothetical protein
VIDHLFQLNDAPLSFIICDHTKSLDVDDLLGSILHQLILRLPDISPSILKWWKGSRSPLNTDTLMELLQEQIGNSRVDLGVDAFDECKCQNELLKRLRQLMESCDINIFITTRPSLISLIKESEGDVRIDVDLESANEDVRRFVQEQVSDPKEDSLRYLPDLIAQGIHNDGNEFRRQLVETVVQKSGGRLGPCFRLVFSSLIQRLRMLIARLHLQNLATQRNLRQLKRVLSNLSVDLEEVYEKNIDRIPELDRELAFHIFSWIALAFRPLRLWELQHALVIDWKDDDIDSVGTDELDLPSRLLQVCVGLVTVTRTYCEDGSNFSPSGRVLFVRESKNWIFWMDIVELIARLIFRQMKLPTSTSATEYP